jgi:hypothetical protein
MPAVADIDVSRRNTKPRQLQENERARLDEFIDSIGYSARFDRPSQRTLHRRLTWGKIDTATANTNTDMSNYLKPCSKPFHEIISTPPKAL